MKNNLHPSLAETPWEKLTPAQQSAARKVHADDPQGDEIAIERCRFFVDTRGRVSPDHSFTVD